MQICTSLMVVRCLLSRACWHRSCCLKVHATILTSLLFLTDYSKYLSHYSTSIYRTLEALATMHYMNTLHHITDKKKRDENGRWQTCQRVRHGVHRRWPHGSRRTSLSFSAQILHSWNVEPISQYCSYCSSVTCMWSSGVSAASILMSGFTIRPSGYR